MVEDTLTNAIVPGLAADFAEDLVHHLLVALRPDIDPGLASADAVDQADEALGVTAFGALKHLRTPTVMEHLRHAGLIES